MLGGGGIDAPVDGHGRHRLWTAIILYLFTYDMFEIVITRGPEAVSVKY